MSNKLQLEQYRQLATQQINKLLGSRWSFAYDRAVRRAGQCDYTNSRITISKHFASSASVEEFKQVLLHEIAHAIVGHGAGHGPLWRRAATELGYTGKRTIKSDFNVVAPWQGFCPSGHKHERFKRPSKRASCGVCSPRFSLSHAITWEYKPLSRG